MIGLLLLFMFLILVLLSLFLNKDVFSPSKFYLVYLFVYFSDIFVSNYSFQTYLAYVSYLLVGLLLVILDVKKWKTKNIYLSEAIEDTNNEMINYKKVFGLLWVISLIPVISQISLISDMGGIEGYINSIGLRVYMWRGKGIVLELIRMYGVINLFYFSLIVGLKTYKKKIWAGFFAHFCIYLLIGFLSGSRSTLLFNFGFMAIIYNYKAKLIKFKTAVSILLIILLSASLLGIIRNGIRWDDTGFRNAFGSDHNFFELSNFKYGLEPIELVFTNTNYNLKNGLTFITPLTNIIPRSIWPSKPDTGGVVITKEYLSNSWGGYSNISTGIIAEGVINFGKILGPIFGIVILIALSLVLSRSYFKITKQKNDKNSLKYNLQLITHIYLLAAIPSLLYTEWTNTILGVILKIVKLILIYLFVKTFSNVKVKKKLLI